MQIFAHPMFRLGMILITGIITMLYASLTGYEKQVVLAWDRYDWATIVVFPILINSIKDVWAFADKSLQEYKRYKEFLAWMAAEESAQKPQPS